MMLLALPQPGPRPRGPVSETAGAAEAACNWSSEPSDRPSRLDPPTRRMSRRVIPRCGSHRSLPGRPGTMIIAVLLSADWRVGLVRGAGEDGRWPITDGREISGIDHRPIGHPPRVRG